VSEVRWSLLGLTGFVVSGILFSVSAIRAGDPWATAGCVVWVVACLVWAVPLIVRWRHERTSD